MTMSDQTRNMHPTPEAVFAMFHWHDAYAAQRGGSMDFFDQLSKGHQRYCEDAVKRIYAAIQEHRYEIVK